MRAIWELCFSSGGQAFGLSICCHCLRISRPMSLDSGISVQQALLPLLRSCAQWTKAWAGLHAPPKCPSPPILPSPPLLLLQVGSTEVRYPLTIQPFTIYICLSNLTQISRCTEPWPPLLNLTRVRHVLSTWHPLFEQTHRAPLKWVLSLTDEQMSHVRFSMYKAQWRKRRKDLIHGWLLSKTHNPMGVKKKNHKVVRQTLRTGIYMP